MKYELINVIDVESTCWDNKEEQKDQFSEIIEIGIAVLNNSTKEIVENTSILVKPQLSTVSKFCTQLTTITTDMLDSAVDFRTACDILVSKFDSQNRVWASWGDYDRNQFFSCCDKFDVLYPFGKRHVNVKVLYTLFRSLKKEPGVNRALNLEGIKMFGTHHRGGDDAYNIAKLFSLMLPKS